MKTPIKTAAMTIILSLAPLAMSHAVPLTTMLQGYLTKPDGTPYTTPQNVEFKVYQAGKPGTAGSGTLVYDELATIIPSATGVFSYLLGSGAPTESFLIVNGQAQPNVLSTATYDTAQSVSVELSINGTTLLPRLQLSGMPYAVISTIAENLKPVQLLKTNGLDAAWATINSSDTAQISLQTSSSIVVQNGGVAAPYFSGKFLGDGTGITGVSASQVAAANVLGGQLSSTVIVSSLAANSITSNHQIAAGANISQAKIENLPFDLANRILKSGDAMSGPLVINNAGLTLNGAAGNVVTQATVTAGSFIGNGAGLTNIAAAQVAAAAVQAGTLNSNVLLKAASLTNGPLNSEILPSTVAYTSTSNIFTAAQTIQNKLTIAPDGIGGVQRLGGIYSGPTGGYSGIGQETSRHQLVFPSWSNVANDTLGAKIVAVNKTAYPSSPWYLAQTSELDIYLLKTGALTADDTVNLFQFKGDGFYANGGVTASWGAFTGTNGYSLSTSSGIAVAAGGVTAPFFNGKFFGDGAAITGITATKVPATGVQDGMLNTGVTITPTNIIGTINNSTFTTLTGATVSNALLDTCVPGTTISLPVGAVPLEVWFTGSVSYGSTHETALSFLVDGGYISPLSSTIGVTIPAPTNTSCQNASWKYRLSPLSAGTHTFCLTAATTGGFSPITITGTNTKCPYENQFRSASQFGVEEKR